MYNWGKKRKEVERGDAKNGESDEKNLYRLKG